MDQVEILVETRARFGDRPYLLDNSQEQPLRVFLSNWPLQQITIDGSDHADLTALIATLGSLLDFPEPAPRNWWAFNDYFGDFERLQRDPVAVVVKNTGSLLDGEVRSVFSVIHRLLSIASDVGTWPDATVPVEYFFFDDWKRFAKT